MSLPIHACIHLESDVTGISWSARRAGRVWRPPGEPLGGCKLWTHPRRLSPERISQRMDRQPRDFPRAGACPASPLLSSSAANNRKPLRNRTDRGGRIEDGTNWSVDAAIFRGRHAVSTRNSNCRCANPIRTKRKGKRGRIQSNSQRLSRPQLPIALCDPPATGRTVGELKSGSLGFQVRSWELVPR